MILIDSNILIASAVATHMHHAQSQRLLASHDPRDALVPAACLSEAYNNLTRPPPRFGMPSSIASGVIDDIAGRFRVVALTPAAIVNGIRQFAARGGLGPQLYDFLIGATGEAFGADTVVTWNVRHFDGLFPHLRIVTPAELAPGQPT